MTTLFNLLQFIIPAWSINILLNLLYPLSQRFTFIKKINTPLDGNACIGKNRLLGNSTTLLGLGVALCGGLIFQIVYPESHGVLIALGMYLGHMLGSFIKRRLGYEDGKYLFGVDHGDGILVAGFLLFRNGYITGLIYILGVITTYLLFPLLCRIGFSLKLRKNKL